MATLTTEQFTEQDRAAVRQVFDACTRYVNAGDWTSWAEMYSEDGFLQPPNAPTPAPTPGMGPSVSADRASRLL
jgi:hypothetical protein